MRLLQSVLLSIALAPTAAPLSAGEFVSDPQFGFRLSVPDGFVQDAEKVRGMVVCAFLQPPAAGEKVGTFIVASRLGGVLGRKKIDPKEIAARNPQITIATEKWKEFDIEVFRVPEKTGDCQLLTFNAQVPLKPEAIQIAVIGDAAREEELRSVLRSVLWSLDGQTNWLTTQERIGRFGMGIGQLLFTIGVLIVGIGVLVVIVGVIVHAIRRKRS